MHLFEARMGDPGRQPPPIILTIAGFDPSSGAGITADLKTFAAHQLYGVSCPTAFTVQSTQGVRRVVPVESGLVTEMLLALADDLNIAGIKIGMLATAGNVHAVATFLDKLSLPASMIVLDPVLQSTSGAELLEPAGIEAMREQLLKRIGWITPNLEELAILTGFHSHAGLNVPDLAHRLQSKAAQSGNTQLHVLVTGGHFEKPDDYLLMADRRGVWLQGDRVATTSTHGTGCAFSSALLSHLVHGMPGVEAAKAAKDYVTLALRHAYPVGRGRGPMNHLFTLIAGGHAN